MSRRELASREAASPFRTRLLLTGFALALYVGFATRTYYWDGILFSLYIEKAAAGQFSKAVLFHPNHLLYNAFGYLLFRAVSALGFHVRALSVLQGVNMAASIVTAGLVFAFTKRLTQSRPIALFSLVLFAFGATWWKFSTDANSYIISVLFATLAVYLLVKEPPQVAASAACYVAAMMFHQLGVFIGIPAACAILLYTGRPRSKRWQIAMAYIGGSAVAILLLYWLCYRQVDHASSPTLLSWILTLSMDWQPGHTIPGLIGGYFGSYLKLFVGGRYTLVRSFLSLPIYLGLVLCVGAIVTAVFLFQRPQPESATTPSRRVGAVLWSWIAGYALFLAWWEPGAAFHKLYLWPPIVLLIASWIAGSSWRTARVHAFTALAAAIAAWNFAVFIFPHAHSTADPVLGFAQTLDQQLPPNTKVYYSNLDSDDWYLEYFAPGRSWLSLPANVDANWVQNALGNEHAPVCFETSALDRLTAQGAFGRNSGIASGAVQRWSLVNKQHRIRFECLAPQ